MQTSQLSIVNTFKPTSPADMAALGYLARYNGVTRETYRVSLKILWDWCGGMGLNVLEMKRPVLELFARYLEADRGNKPSTVAHHLSIVRGFYNLAEIDGYIEKSPATHLRMPRVYRDESATLGLDRMELGSLIATARASHAMDSALGDPHGDAWFTCI